jgi:hypothetical protein
MRAACWAAFTVAAGAAAAAPVSIRDPGQGAVAIATGSTGAAQLSGITRSAGSTYHAVGDDGRAAIWTLSIAIDGTTGRVGSAAVTGSLTAAVGADAEGIAFRAASNSLFVVDESTSTVREFALPGAAVSGTVPVPAIYAAANVQANLGLESLAFGGGGLWTANEEALVPDGPRSTTTAGSWVRIQRFDALLNPAGQWAYRTQPTSTTPAFGPAAQSGVVDLLPWTETTLLVLEREFLGVAGGFQSRLYAVDVAAASDVSGLASIAADGFTPLSKTLLWEKAFPLTNFEGMTFGPTLADGSTSLLLVSDDAGGLNTQSLYPLIVVPEPPVAVPVVVAALVAQRSVRRRFPWPRRRFMTTAPSPCRPAGPPARCRPR